MAKQMAIDFDLPNDEIDVKLINRDYSSESTACSF